jgi:hypothetical protein
MLFPEHASLRYVASYGCSVSSISAYRARPATALIIQYPLMGRDSKSYSLKFHASTKMNLSVWRWSAKRRYAERCPRTRYKSPNTAGFLIFIRDALFIASKEPGATKLLTPILPQGIDLSLFVLLDFLIIREPENFISKAEALPNLLAYFFKKSLG